VEVVKLNFVLCSRAVSNSFFVLSFSKRDGCRSLVKSAICKNRIISDDVICIVIWTDVSVELALHCSLLVMVRHRVLSAYCLLVKCLMSGFVCPSQVRYGTGIGDPAWREHWPFPQVFNGGSRRDKDTPCGLRRVLRHWFVCRFRRYIYISRACLHRMLLHLFFFSLLFYLSFPLRIDPLRFQVGGHERRPNQGFFSVLVYFML